MFSVGRLDRNTTGALLLTNDGDLAFRLTHPKFGVYKTYHVQVGQTINPGRNVGVGSDYTLFALVDGVVTYEHASRTKKRVSVYPGAAPAAAAN